jgi:hypothetical protein
VAVTIVLSTAATSPAAVRVSSRAVINLQDGHVDVSPPSVRNPAYSPLVSPLHDLHSSLGRAILLVLFHT